MNRIVTTMILFFYSNYILISEEDQNQFKFIGDYNDSHLNVKIYKDTSEIKKTGNSKFKLIFNSIKSECSILYLCSSKKSEGNQLMFEKDSIESPFDLGYFSDGMVQNLCFEGIVDKEILSIELNQNLINSNNKINDSNYIEFLHIDTLNIKYSLHIYYVKNCDSRYKIYNVNTNKYNIESDKIYIMDIVTFRIRFNDYEIIKHNFK